MFQEIMEMMSMMDVDKVTFSSTDEKTAVQVTVERKGRESPPLIVEHNADYQTLCMMMRSLMVSVAETHEPEDVM